MSDYPHDREWEIPPEERDVPDTPTPQVDMSMLNGPNASSASTSTRTRTRDSSRTQSASGRFQSKRQRQSQSQHQPGPEPTEDEDEDESPSMLIQFLKAVFGPILGFVLISTITLVWSAIVLGGITIYSALGNTITMTVFVASAMVWMFGLKGLLAVLYHGAE